jgi:uncharacterized phage-associated protein
MKAYPQLKSYGAETIMKREYGKYLKDVPENGYNVTLEFNLEEMLDNRGRFSFSYPTGNEETPLTFENISGHSQKSVNVEAKCFCGTL